MIKIICDCCLKEKKIKKYWLPQPYSDDIDIIAQDKIVGRFQGETLVEPEEVDLCDDCAFKLFGKLVELAIEERNQ